MERDRVLSTGIVLSLGVAIVSAGLNTFLATGEVLAGSVRLVALLGGLVLVGYARARGKLSSSQRSGVGYIVGGTPIALSGASISSTGDLGPFAILFGTVSFVLGATIFFPALRSSSTANPRHSSVRTCSRASATPRSHPESSTNSQRKERNSVNYWNHYCSGSRIGTEPKRTYSVARATNRSEAAKRYWTNGRVFTPIVPRCANRVLAVRRRWRRASRSDTTGPRRASQRPEEVSRAERGESRGTRPRPA
jgi:hypothetical protein